ncbi:hypothetical protein NB713_003147 [Xanthomonas sacchari]|nr:hypothetical protein [Xanthomonas sacchari]
MSSTNTTSRTGASARCAIACAQAPASLCVGSSATASSSASSNPHQPSSHGQRHGARPSCARCHAASNASGTNSGSTYSGSRERDRHNTSSGSSSHRVSNSGAACCRRNAGSRHHCRSCRGNCQAQRASAGVHGSVPRTRIGAYATAQPYHCALRPNASLATRLTTSSPTKYCSNPGWPWITARYQGSASTTNRMMPESCSARRGGPGVTALNSSSAGSGSRPGGPLVMNARAKPAHIAAIQRLPCPGGCARASTKAHTARVSQAASRKSVEIHCAAPNGASMVAYSSAACAGSSGRSGNSRAARRHTSSTHSR